MPRLSVDLESQIRHKSLHFSDIDHEETDWLLSEIDALRAECAASKERAEKAEVALAAER